VENDSGGCKGCAVAYPLVAFFGRKIKKMVSALPFSSEYARKGFRITHRVVYRIVIVCRNAKTFPFLRTVEISA
jgi:hypothetical protein